MIEKRAQTEICIQGYILCISIILPPPILSEESFFSPTTMTLLR